MAVSRWAGSHHNLDEDVVAQVFSTPAQSMEELDPEIRDAIASDALASHRASSAHLRDRQSHLVRRPGGPPPQRTGAAVSTAGPDYERVAAVLVRIGLRMVSEGRVHENTVHEDEVEQEGSDVDGGLLPGVDGGASGVGLLDRRAS